MCSNCSGDYEDPEMTTADEDVDILGQPSLQTWLERCHAIDVIQQRLRATNDSRALAASNANSRMLLDALRDHI